MELSGNLDKFCHVLFFFQDRESKILQLERQLHEQSGRLLTLGSPRSDVLNTENGVEPGGSLTTICSSNYFVFCMKTKLLLSADLTDKMMKRANEGLQKQCMEKDEVALTT